MTANMQLRVILIFMLISILAACSEETVTSIPASTPTSVKIPMTHEVTENPVSPSILTPTPRPDCITIAKQFPEDFQATGKVVLSGALFDSPSLLLALDSGKKIDLPLGDDESVLFWMFSVSPDKTRLAYGGASTDQWGKSVDKKIHFITANGTEYKVIPMEQDWADFSWLNDTQLLIERLIPEGNFTSSPLLFNLITGQKQELTIGDSEIMYFDQIEWGLFSLSRTAYNWDLTKVAYPVLGEHHPIRLVDVRTGKTLADIPTTDYGREPAWSPDGKQLAFISDIGLMSDAGIHDEVFLIRENNQSNRLTYLSKEYPDYVLITSLAWSPDGQFLAFWMSTDKNAGYRGRRLTVLDTSTGDVLEYCDPGSLVSFSDPVWSPDGKYLLIGLSNDRQDNLHSVVLIINSVTGEVFQIAEDYQPMGWLK